MLTLSEKLLLPHCDALSARQANPNRLQSGRKVCFVNHSKEAAMMEKAFLLGDQIEKRK